MRPPEYIASCCTIVYSGARVTDVPYIIYHNWGDPERAPHRRVARSQSIYTSDMQGLFGASLSSRRMFSLFVELILKLSFAVSPLSALELMYRGGTNLYRQ